jgi:Protein of unknown function (DUF2726)
VDRSKPSYLGDPLPDAAWPVTAKSLLTNREMELYKTLHGLYPDHRLFVQVALSQLIDVAKNHPERNSIRARFSQLVADFVLCRPDLSVVAVIELDDWSHALEKRKMPDARKNKALADSGLRLIRIPDGPIPSAEKLHQIICSEPEPSVSTAKHTDPRRISSESDFRLADDWTSNAAHEPLPMDPDRVAAQAMRSLAIKAAAGLALLAAFWFVYSQVIPNVIQSTLHPLAARARPVSSAVPPAAASSGIARATAAPLIPSPSQEDLAEKRAAEVRSMAELQRQKDRAWADSYSSPASCEHPPDWNAQVDCGNQYMRAKRAFEEQWGRTHGSGNSSAPAVVLENPHK